MSDDLTGFISRDGAELFTDSRAVALAFKKRHKNVLRIIDAMQRSDRAEIAEHGRLNFEPSSYVNAQGKRQPMYRMTPKGLSELTMSFSGDDARVIRIRFINAFEEVANRLADAERTIAERLHDFERRAIPSATKGKIGSKLMHERRREKRGLDLEEAMLKAQAQSVLPGLVQAPTLQIVGRKQPVANDARKKRQA